MSADEQLPNPPRGARPGAPRGRRLPMPDGGTVGLGSIVECRVGRSTPKSGRRMSPERDYKGVSGKVVAIHSFVPVDLPDAHPAELEVAVLLPRGGFAWFPTDQIVLVDEAS